MDRQVEKVHSFDIRADIKTNLTDKQVQSDVFISKFSPKIKQVTPT